MADADNSPAVDQRSERVVDGSMTLLVDTTDEQSFMQSLPVELRSEVNKAIPLARSRGRQPNDDPAMPPEDQLVKMLAAATLAGTRTATGYARLFGITPSMFLRWRAKYPVISQTIESVDEHLKRLVIRPLLAEIYNGKDPNTFDDKAKDSALRRRWRMLERLWPEEYAPAGPAVQINTQINQAPVPQPMSRADYDRLVLDAHAARQARLAKPEGDGT
jgi:hypothetical protein